MDPSAIRSRTVEVWLHDGEHILVRPVVPEDKPVIKEGFDRLSEESRYRRFMGKKNLTERDLAYLTEMDYVDHFALVAIGREPRDYQGLGVARYVRDGTDPQSAEAAVAVVDEHHGRGIGTLLLAMLGAVALENGIRRFTGYLLADNRPVIDMLNNLGARIEFDSAGMSRMTIDLPAQMEELKETPLYAVLRAVARGDGSVVSSPER
ncbi:MAG: GNAT family N-acetyltransferase [Actinomycetota bacterium]